MYVAPTESESLEAREGPELQVLIDELAARQCTQDEFVERVLQCESTDPDAVWEVLALLDQNFRRKRIDRDTFVCLKSRLQRHSLGARGDARPVPKASPAAAAPPPPRAAALEMPGPVRPASAAPAAPLPAMHAVEPHDPDAQPEEGHGLLEASFHREVRVGDLLCGRYRVVEILRRREWMSVLEAVDEPKAGMPGVRQRVALQVLDDNLSQDTLLLQRIGKLQTLSHPAIMRVLDIEEDNGSLVLVSDFFSGVSLRTLLERRADRRVPLQSALTIVRTLASALAYAHARGVAHGDVTAGNVLITDLGDTRLQGFELRAQSHTVQPGADRMAFARLAYELLAGTAEPVTALTSTSLSKLRAPPGITRAQWRVLRATLAGRDTEGNAGILAAFGGDAAAAGEPVVLVDGGAPPPPRRRHLREWLAAGIVAVILGGGLFFYLQALPAADPAGVQTAWLPAEPLDAASQGVESPPPVIALDADAPAAAPAGTAITQGTAGGRLPAADARVTGSATPDSRTPATAIAGETAPPPAPAPATPRAPPAARASIDLASTYAWVDTTEPVARIWVMRRGTPSREVTFRWWTETGTAQVDRDFRAIEPRVGVIPEGSRGVELLVPLMPDPTRREPRTFYVKIDEPGPGADLGTRTLMQVAIVPPGYPAARDTPVTTQNLALPLP